MTSSNALCGPVRVSRSLTSVLKMGLLMLASTALFQRSTAVSIVTYGDFAVDGTNSHHQQLLLRGSSPDYRELFDPRPPYDFYNGACESECAKDEDLMVFDNACPKCPEKYESQHCNHCCFDGASSLRIRWHGCPGEVTFVSKEQGTFDCQLDLGEFSSELRFIDCLCYEQINTPETFDAFTCHSSLVTTLTMTSQNGMEPDICIVSVEKENDGSMRIDLSKPLPDVIGLVHNPLDEDDEEYTSQYWNPVPFRTYFDTTCSIINNETAPYVLPLFPGYGKVPNTCPSDGFIDLKRPETPALPDELDHFDGKPSTEPFWFEFIDGTSTGFWPSEETGNSTDYSFDPTFATCSCNDCVPSPPTAPAPSVAADSSPEFPSGVPLATMKPTLTASGEPSVEPTLKPSGEHDCPPSGVGSVEESESPSASASPSLAPSAQPSFKPSLVPSAQPSFKPSLVPSAQPSVKPALVPSAQLSVKPSLVPSAQPSFKPSLAPSAEPSVKPALATSAEPSVKPALVTSAEPSVMPSLAPSAKPSVKPSLAPSAQASFKPSLAPSAQASFKPSLAPSVKPSLMTSAEPSVMPSLVPSAEPTVMPSLVPSAEPTVKPSLAPSAQASFKPSLVPSAKPSVKPSLMTSAQPSVMPSLVPSAQPSVMPSLAPSAQPSVMPSLAPSAQPSVKPTSTEPSVMPSLVPSAQPSVMLSLVASVEPTLSPTLTPTNSPTKSSSDMPSFLPTDPTMAPTEHDCPPTFVIANPPFSPSMTPSKEPSVSPSDKPSITSSSMPSYSPTSTPTDSPTKLPSDMPSFLPTTADPTIAPSEHDCPPTSSGAPTMAVAESAPAPSAAPTDVEPASQPSDEPSAVPSGEPSFVPSEHDCPPSYSSVPTVAVAESAPAPSTTPNGSCESSLLTQCVSYGNPAVQDGVPCKFP